MRVNTEIRIAVEAELRRQNISKKDLAAKLGIAPQALSRTLNHVEGERTLWPRILTALGLELTVRPAPARAEGEK